jgi:hypothetical protein
MKYHVMKIYGDSEGVNPRKEISAVGGGEA